MITCQKLKMLSFISLKLYLDLTYIHFSQNREKYSNKTTFFKDLTPCSLVLLFLLLLILSGSYSDLYQQHIFQIQQTTPCLVGGCLTYVLTPKTAALHSSKVSVMSTRLHNITSHKKVLFILQNNFFAPSVTVQLLVSYCKHFAYTETLL